MRIALVCGLLVLLSAFGSERASAQVRHDSISYEVPRPPDRKLADSLDSAYRASRAMIDKWIREHRVAPGPREEFASLYFMIGGLIRVSPRDINQYFAERAFRPDPQSDRTAYRSSDFAFTIGANFQLSRTWGLFVEYDYTGTFFNTIIDASTSGVNGLEESLDLTEHALVTGGTVQLYGDRFYHLHAIGGLGGVFALVDEEEPATNASRTSSATGLQLNFDLANDFRIGSWGGARIDLMTRSTMTGRLKTSSGQTLDAPFGKAQRRTSIAPAASKSTFGFLVGLFIDL
jgi:hypothetical protein